MEAFYSQLAAIAFTLVGLWWVVVQMKYELWMNNRARWLVAYATSANFIAIGGISLVSILEGEASQIWRVGTAVGALLGGAAAAFSLLRGQMSTAQRVSQAVVVVLFAAIFALCFVFTPIFGLRPVVIEAVIEVGVLVLSVHVVWQFFAERKIEKG